jgi:hypothetical protein
MDQRHLHFRHVEFRGAQLGRGRLVPLFGQQRDGDRARDLDVPLRPAREHTHHDGNHVHKGDGCHDGGARGPVAAAWLEELGSHRKTLKQWPCECN